MIDMKKQYRTRDGRKVRVLATDANHPNYPVVALIEIPGGEEFASHMSIDGRMLIHCKNNSDLIEYNPAQDLKVDQPLLVFNFLGAQFQRRHFAEFKDGEVWCFDNGQTSFTSIDGRSSSWRNWTDDLTLEKDGK